MAAAKERRVLKCVLFLQVFGLISAINGSSLSDLKIEVFQPGFRASMPDAAGLTYLAFNGTVTHGGNTIGYLIGEVREPTNGSWVIEEPQIQLKIGDVIKYFAYVLVNGTVYLSDRNYLSYKVTAFADRSVDTQPVNCPPTTTTVRGGKACGGQTIFEDDFNTLREDVWQIEQFIPVSSHPEHPFVSYQRLSSDPVVSVSNGYLHIALKIQQKMPGFTNESIYLGTLDLFSGCTSRAEECYRQASGSDILPPVVSGRLTSSGFAFKYGTVHVKAKLPQGDWLYPEILLEPFLKKYGSSNYASGVLKIAAARGNSELRVGSEEFGNKILYGGPIMDAQCREQMMSKKVLDGGRWGDQFHEYSITWTPQYIALSVDGEEWARVDATGGLLSRFTEACAHLPRVLLEKGSRIAPFDDFFSLTLGVAAGGITEFPDDSYSGGGRPKPWRNSARKGMLAFWEDLLVWENTWTQPELLIDYIKVVAL